MTVEEAARATRPRRASLSGARALPHPAVLTLAGLAAAWVVTFGVLVVRRHHGFWDLDFDMGIHDQSVWLLAHGRGFITVRGLQVFGHHATPGYFLLVPAYWLGAGPDFLNVFQVVMLALAAVPLYLLARERHLTPWAAAAVGAAILLHPAVQFFSWELFHPEVIAITPLLCAYLCAVRRSWRWFTLWTVLAVSWKEDVALAVIVLGLLLALRGNRERRRRRVALPPDAGGDVAEPWPDGREGAAESTRAGGVEARGADQTLRVGLITAGLALAWFLLWTVVLFPAINGGHVQSEGIYTGVGGSAGEMTRTLLTNPGEITSRVLSSESVDFAWRLVVPFGFMPLLAPLVALIGVPQFLLDAVSDVEWTRVINHHYAALCVAALALATVEGVAFASRRFGRTARSVAPVVVLAGAVFGTLAWGPSPIGDAYDKGFWPPTVDTRIDAKRAAVALIPDGARVSATYGLVPQVSQRPEIYSFPNPWRSKNFGIDGSPRRSPHRVDWLLVDRAVVLPDPEASALLDSILASGNFRIVFDRDELVVARRVHG
jgi:uncharacterized membrane protein